MKNTLINSLAVVLIALIIASCSSDNSFSPVQSFDKVSNNNKETYIVAFDEANPSLSSSDAIMSQIDNLAAFYAIESNDIIFRYDNVVKGFAARLDQTQLEKLQSDRRIKYIEKDQIISVNDPIEYIGTPKTEKTLSQTVPWGITAIGGSMSATSNTGVAWIVDTGIDLDHPDLNVDLARSRTFVTYGQDSISANDLNGHGTHVAGIVGAIDNSFGSVGVCSGAQLIAVKVLNSSGSGSVTQIVNGLNYVKNNLIPGRINVVNMSLAGSGSTTLDNAVKSLADAGAYVVVAAGNNSRLAAYYSPARVNYTRVFTISAFDNNGAFASTFSNFGTVIDFAAPGVSVYSTYKDGQYATLSGTSMATPYAAGILLARNGSISYLGTVTNDKDTYPDKKARR